MDTVKNLGIRDFENRSGGSVGAQLTYYLTDIAKSRIQATGKFTVVAPNDPSADGVFFGELRNVTSKDSQNQSQRKDQNGNTITETTYLREVSVEFVYGVNNSRTNMPFGTVNKKASSRASSRDDPSGLTDTLTLAKGIVDSEMRGLEKDLVPTIVSTNRELMKETSKDKNAKQQMKTTLALVKNGNYEEAIKQYDEIDATYGSVAARTNAKILREAIASDIAASSRMAQIDSERTGLTGKAVKGAVESLNSKLPSGSVIMIMKTNSAERNLLNDVVDQMTASVIQARNLKVVDRSNQTLINAEQQFQMSGNVSDASAVSIGRQLGAKYVVLCWISGVSSRRRLNLSVLSIETGEVIDQSDFEI
jgi:TolB-like protein